MAIVVVGGHSRSVGKTSVAAGLIAATPELRWTAVKITQYGHGICSADGKPCACATADHSWAILEERDRSGESDSSRFLVAGAERSLWVRTRQGELAAAMPALRKMLLGAENIIIESNSVMRFLRPDVYLTVLDYAVSDFKATALRYLDLASAIVLHDAPADVMPAWSGVSMKLIARKPVFRVQPPKYVTAEMVEFIRERLAKPAPSQIAELPN